jgi:murein L,D-transpeptidase YcbB/YkuD
MDTWLTYLYLKYASDLADGVSDLAHADPAWQIDTEPFDALAHLEQALQDHRIAESLTALTPTDDEYSALRKALADYRAIAARGGWPTVPASLKLKPGQSSPAVRTLALRLAASGDFRGEVPGDDHKAAVYGPDLENAVKHFQRRHGLSDDGAVGRSVVAELNVPVDARVRQIQLNMERWRWLPRELGDPHILVNIPQMRLDVREHGQVPLSMRVVVGKEDTPTPIFNQRMTYLVFAPYWNVPDDIAQQETLPSVLKDAGFLARAGMEVIDASGRAVDPESVDLEEPGRYRFRQRPGTSNSLGMVKFMFPNQFNVYLHDTPADSLFARASRSLSHGCVRLEAPAKLAAYVLRDQPEWTTERIAQAMAGTDEQIVKLKVPVPVYLGYWTARVAQDGSVEFRKDVYGVDRRQTLKLAERLERLRRSSTAAAAAGTLATPALAAR